ncbi:MAG: DUF4385 domain-containing protein [Candidatus Eremiobacteraeota bacterium]|nr:DUF4385 domain-containing protein [Candidatus Eremiobacteraeota bacterium]
MTRAVTAREKFDYKRDYARLDFRAHPELYQVGVGEQGVLLVQPYKSEILPHWRFATEEAAEESAARIYRLFEEYREAGDFPGMDMARKFLQMGVTRSRRYANHRSGKKYRGPVPDDQKGRSGAHGRSQLPLDPDPVKARCAEIFREKLLLAKNDPVYQQALHQAVSPASRESQAASPKRARSESHSLRQRRA